jgi:hypothetical protein
MKAIYIKYIPRRKDSGILEALGSYNSAGSSIIFILRGHLKGFKGVLGRNKQRTNKEYRVLGKYKGN